jgi:hypothetical protein
MTNYSPHGMAVVLVGTFPLPGLGLGPRAVHLAL